MDALRVHPTYAGLGIVATSLVPAWLHIGVATVQRMRK